MRCFVALPLDAPVHELLRRTIDRLRRSAAAVRWVRPASVHLTLKFLGDVARGRVDEVGEALRGVETTGSLSLGVSGLGTFPPGGRPRVVWAGLCGDVGGLEELAAAVERALQPLGFPGERRPFRPHLTLGRVKAARGLDALLAELDRATVESEPALVEQLVLYESRLRPEGAKYDELVAVAL